MEVLKLWLWHLCYPPLAYHNSNTNNNNDDRLNITYNLHELLWLLILFHDHDKQKQNNSC